MLNKKEIALIISASLILALTTSLLRSRSAFFYALLFIFLAIIINVFAKKIASYYFESETEIGIWEIRHFGVKNKPFKRPFPIGFLFPLIITAITLGYVTWMAPLTFEVKPKTHRAVKRHGFYSFSEMTEFHIGLIAAAGVTANLFFALIFYFIGFPEFSRISVYFAAFNMIPFSSLDGNKIFFGNFVMWCALAIITLVGVLYSFLLI